MSAAGLCRAVLLAEPSPGASGLCRTPGVLPGEHSATPKAPWTQNGGFLPLFLSFQAVFWVSLRVQGDTPAVSPSLSRLFAQHDKDLKPSSPGQRCRDHGLRQRCRTWVARAGFSLPFCRLGQSQEPGCGSRAVGAPGLRASPICVLDADYIPLKFPWQGARCPGHILIAITASQLSPSSDPDPDLTFPIGILNVPSGELDFWLLGAFLALSCPLKFPLWKRRFPCGSSIKCISAKPASS